MATRPQLVLLLLLVRFGGAWLGVAAALWAFGAAAQVPRWVWGPKLELGSLSTLPLADGRLLSCSAHGANSGCEIVDPLSGEHHAVPVAPELLHGAVALDDGQLLLPASRSLLDPETGATRRLPQIDRQLEQMQATSISGGRAAFHSASGSPNCHRLLFFLGAERGFREVIASTPTACVERVFDLGDGTLLVARAPRSPRYEGARDLDFVRLKLDDWTWQQGARLPWLPPHAAFRHPAGIVVLLFDSHPSRPYPIEALFLDHAARSPRLAVLPRKGLEFGGHRFGKEGVVILDRHGAVLWDPRRRSIVPLPFPGPRQSDARLIERNGQLLVVDPRTRRALVLSRNPPPRQTPCDDAFAYAEALIAGNNSQDFDRTQLDALMPGAVARACRDHLERQQRFPDALQLPLEALPGRAPGPASAEEETAAQLLCTLLPSWGAPHIRRINQGGLLTRGPQPCRTAEEQLLVLAAARGPGGASGALLQYGFSKDSGRDQVRSSILDLLASHEELAQAAAPLLRAAEQRGAGNRQYLYDLLCKPNARPDLAEACEQRGSYEEPELRDHRRRILLNFGAATAVIGGLGTLAYLGRNGGGGRALAIGSGIVGGAALGAAITISNSEGGDTQGLFGLMLAVPISILGGVAGGLIASHSSKEPGSARFATAAVPLSLAWLTGVALTVDAW